MENSFFNEYDVVVLVIIITSSLLSLLRGFIREVFSIAAWIGAGVITFIYFGTAAEYLSQRFDNKVIVSAIAVGGLYLTSLIILSVINSVLLDFSREVRLGAIDRSLGLAFGLLRGFIIVSIIHYTINLIYSNKEEPNWLTTSKAYNLTGLGSDFIKDFTFDYIKSKPSEAAHELNNRLSSVFVNSIPGATSQTGFKNKEIFRKIMAGMPKQDQDDLEQKLNNIGSNASDNKKSELLLELLVTYKNASQVGLVKPDNTLNEDETKIVEDSIRNLEKGMAAAQEVHEEPEPSTDTDKKDEVLPWMQEKSESTPEPNFKNIDTIGE